MKTHLVIPDTHAHPDHPNDRYEWLGKLVVDIKPNTVIQLGDWADMPSLCTYEQRTRAFEGRRYKRDIESATDAQERFAHPIRKAKRKRPRFISLIGNHENRIDRAINTDHHKLDGIISLDDLQFKEYGWEVVDYNGQTPGVINVDGINYAHYFTSGVMGRPITGLHPAYQLLIKQYSSCTQGHVHTTDYCVRTAADGSMVHGLVAGVFCDYYMEWAGESNNLWWNGVIIKRGVENGQYDPEWISLDRIKKEYNKK